MNRNYIIAGVVLFVAVIVAWGLVLNKPQSDANDTPPVSVTVRKLHEQAAAFKSRGETLQAKTFYQEIIKNYPDADNIASIQKEMEETSMSLVLSTAQVPGKTVLHEVVIGDTLAKIAKRYGTTVEFIKKSNNLKSDVIRLGQKLRAWTVPFNIFIDKSQNVLILKDGDDILKTYIVATGEKNSTPVGQFMIESKLIDPVWFHRGVIVPPESPANVLGSRWLGFDLPGYGIHGTTAPETIGKQATAGCIRMLKDDIEELYSLVPQGTQVKIID